MAALPTKLHSPSSLNNLSNSTSSIITFKAGLKLRVTTLTKTLAHTNHSIQNSNSVYSFRNTSVSNALKQSREDCSDQRNGTLRDSERWVEFIRDILPGGSWWNLSDCEREIGGSPIASKTMTVGEALREMWALVADEKWVLYVAFGALTVAAVRLLVYAVPFGYMIVCVCVCVFSDGFKFIVDYYML